MSTVCKNNLAVNANIKNKNADLLEQFMVRISPVISTGQSHTGSYWMLKHSILCLQSYVSQWILLHVYGALWSLGA